MTVPFRTENRHKRELTFYDAPVAMPIISTNVYNKQHNSKSLLDEDYGVLTQKDTGEEDPIVVRNGVYFLKMYVSNGILRPREGFGRPA